MIDHDLILGLQLLYSWACGYLIWQDLREDWIRIRRGR